MAFALFLVYFAFTFIRPFEIFPEYARYSPMLILGLVALLTALVTRATRRDRILGSPQLLLVGLFVLWCVLSVILAVGWLAGAADALNHLSANLFAFYLLVLNVDTLRRFRITVGLMTFLLVGLSVEGIAAYHVGYRQDELTVEQSTSASAREGAERLDQFSEEPDRIRRIRSRGFLNDPNDFAQALIAALPLVLLFREGGAGLENALRVYLPTAVMLYAVVLTRSRGGLLALLALMFLALRGRLTAALSAGVTVLGGAALLTLGAIAGRTAGMDESTEARLEAMRQGLLMLKASPLWGVGWGMFTEHHPKVAHNAYVHCLAELGLVGYFIWLGILVWAIRELSAMYAAVSDVSQAEELSRSAGAVALALGAFLVAAFFLSRTYSTMLFVLVGLGTSLSDLGRRRHLPMPRLGVGPWALQVGMLEVVSVVVIYLIARVLSVQ